MAESMNLSIEEFTVRLASKAPTPGGGGAAGLCGALSAGLCSMYAQLSSGRKKYAPYEEKLGEAIKKAELLRQEYLLLIDKDAEVFLPLRCAYAIDKNEPGRAETIEKASLNACRAAEKMIRLGGETAELLKEMYTLANPALLSDVGCGAAILAAALKCAAMNVLVNTRGYKDNAEAQKLNALVKEALCTTVPDMEALAASVLKNMEE